MSIAYYSVQRQFKNFVFVCRENIFLFCYLYIKIRLQKNSSVFPCLMSKKIRDVLMRLFTKPNFTNNGLSRRTLLLAFFTAFSASLYLADSLIPKPLPFFKLGLANVSILLLFSMRDYTGAFIVGVSKTFIASLFIGTLFSPATLLSLAGTLLSLTALIIGGSCRFPFSIIGFSILAAVFHNIGQVMALRFFLMPETPIFHFLPSLMLIGVVAGSLTGYVAHRLREPIISYLPTFFKD